MNITIGTGRARFLLVAAFALFTIVGILSVAPIHAQSTLTTTANSSAGSSANAPGHACPNMNSSSSTSSMSSSNSSPGTATTG